MSSSIPIASILEAVAPNQSQSFFNGVSRLDQRPSAAALVSFGTGSALRSTLPAAFKGSLRRKTKESGIIYARQLDRSCVLKRAILPQNFSQPRRRSTGCP